MTAVQTVRVAAPVAMREDRLPFSLIVMAGLDPAIQAVRVSGPAAKLWYWMAGSSPAMTG